MSKACENLTLLLFCRFSSPFFPFSFLSLRDKSPSFSVWRRTWFIAICASITSFIQIRKCNFNNSTFWDYPQDLEVFDGEHFVFCILCNFTNLVLMFDEVRTFCLLSGNMFRNLFYIFSSKWIGVWHFPHFSYVWVLQCHNERKHCEKQERARTESSIIHPSQLLSRTLGYSLQAWWGPVNLGGHSNVKGGIRLVQKFT